MILSLSLPSSLDPSPKPLPGRGLFFSGWDFITEVIVPKVDLFPGQYRRGHEPFVPLFQALWRHRFCPPFPVTPDSDQYLRRRCLLLHIDVLQIGFFQKRTPSAYQKKLILLTSDRRCLLRIFFSSLLVVIRSIFLLSSDGEFFKAFLVAKLFD